MSQTFDYMRAFDRNIGWVTADEQLTLKSKRIAIAGLGGVGGIHLVTLARLGVGAFNLADFDTFEIQNFNRQAGAMMSSLGQKKMDVIEAQARDINPELDLRLFDAGVHEWNIAEFLKDVDVYVDSLDFFVLEQRRQIFAYCYEHGIPAVTAGPVGMGTAYMCFMPGGMSFEQYFRFEGKTLARQLVQFLVGLTPKAPQRAYLVDPSRVDFEARRVPSLGLSCMLCAGVAGAEVLKILLKRGKVRTAPHYQQFDAYLNRYIKGYMPFGNANPLQRLKIYVVSRLLNRFKRQSADKS